MPDSTIMQAVTYGYYNTVTLSAPTLDAEQPDHAQVYKVPIYNALTLSLCEYFRSMETVPVIEMYPFPL